MGAIDFMTSLKRSNSDWFNIGLAEELMCSVTEKVACRKNRVEDIVVADVFDFTGRVVIEGANKLVELSSHLCHTGL